MFLPKLSSGTLRTRSATSVESGLVPSQNTGAISCQLTYNCCDSSGRNCNRGMQINATGNAMSDCCANAGTNAYANCGSGMNCQMATCEST